MTTDAFWEFAVIIALWLLPAAYCWLIGTLLEIDFAISGRSISAKN